MRESTPAGPADLPADEATTELAILEQTDSLDGIRLAKGNPFGLHPDPIPQDWILEGNPTARRRQLVGSSDNLASTHMWDCTAGQFNWHYKSDETIYVLEGSVVVEDAAGVRRRLGVGDTFLFPAGTCFHWTVPHYIRKLAFLHAPLSRKMQVVKGIYNFLKSPFKRGQPATTWTG
ncbi:MAG TPA: cupin domain-containing protein [Steroidobacteraceae bacterium]|nr:cupin domain-containing protein [Steroidobacteraceae bacterium]